MSHRSIFFAAISTMVEWYDFSLYLYLAPILSRVFFAGVADSEGVVFAGFAIAYFLRPVGAIVFGHIGDTYGRRTTMLLSMGLMLTAAAATSILPTEHQIGYSAGVLLLALRCVMSFSVGGEYNAVVAYLVEGSRADRRGLVTSLACAASEVGGLLAVAVSALVVTWFDRGAVEAWAWRIPFWVGSAFAALVLLGRVEMEESPRFTERVRRHRPPRAHLRHTLVGQWPAVLRTFAISALGSISYYVGIAYVPTFLALFGGTGKHDALWAGTYAAIAAIVTTPIVGLLADRYGRRAVLIALSLVTGIASGPIFALMATGPGPTQLTMTLAMAVLSGGISAVGAVATAEQFGTENRLSGLALGASSATALFGGITPYLAHRITSLTGKAYAPGLLIAATALCVLPVVATMQPARAPALD